MNATDKLIIIFACILIFIFGYIMFSRLDGLPEKLLLDRQETYRAYIKWHPEHKAMTFDEFESLRPFLKVNK